MIMMHKTFKNHIVVGHRAYVLQWRKNHIGNQGDTNFRDGLQKYSIIALYRDSYPRQTASRMTNNEN